MSMESRVNKYLMARLGIGTMDLPDYCWGDHDGDDCSPEEIIVDYAHWAGMPELIEALGLEE